MDIVADLILELLGKITRHCKSPKTQMVVDILVASVFLLAVDGFAIWNAISYYQQGNVIVAAIFAAVVVISLLLVGGLVLRRIIRRKE